MIQVAGLLLSGVLAMGLWWAEGFVILLSCWLMGMVLLAGLAASGSGQRAAGAAREAFLVESAGACVLAVSGLAVVLAAETTRLDLLAQRLPLLPRVGGMHAWVGGAVLLAVVCRLGLPPLTWWPARAAVAPPAVRVFLLAGLHPATAIMLWYRLEAWLQPWHQVLALWLGGSAALLLIMAAAGEWHGPRRAAWLGASHWAGHLAAGTDPMLPAVLLLAVGMSLVQLQAVLVRWPIPVQRSLLLTGGAAVLAAGLVSGLARPDSPPAVLRLAAALMTAVVLRRWWFAAARADVLPPEPALRRPALSSMAWLARLGMSSGPAQALAALSMRSLGALVSGFDRIALAGVVAGLGWVGLKAGWLVAWIDRRGQDIVYGGASRLLGLAGRAAVHAAGGSPRRLLILGLLVILGLAWLGWTAG